MTVESLIIFLLIGAIAGWLAGQIMKGGGYGLVGDIIVGIIGPFIGGWLFGRLGIAAGGIQSEAKRCRYLHRGFRFVWEARLRSIAALTSGTAATNTHAV